MVQQERLLRQEGALAQPRAACIVDAPARPGVWNHMIAKLAMVARSAEDFIACQQELRLRWHKQPMWQRGARCPKSILVAGAVNSMKEIVAKGAIDDATDKQMKEVIGKYASEFSL